MPTFQLGRSPLTVAADTGLAVVEWIGAFRTGRRADVARAERQKAPRARGNS